MLRHEVLPREDDPASARLQRVLSRADALHYLFFLLAPALLVWRYAAGDTWPHSHEGLRYPMLGEHFSQAFLSGQGWPRWLPNINFGYGYPTFVFYQPLVFFLALPFRLILGDSVGSMWAVVAVALSIGAIGSYRLFARDGKQLAGLFAGLLFLLSPWIYVDWLVRGDLAELLALGLAVWPLYFLYAAERALLRGEIASGPLVGLSVSLAGVLLAHPITGLLLAASLVLIVLALCVGNGRVDFRALACFALSGVAAAGLATPYWHPMLSLRSAVNLHNVAVGYYQTTTHAVHWQQLLSGAWGFGASIPNSPLDGMPFGLGRLHLVAALTGAVIGWRSRYVRGVLLALALALYAMTPSASYVWTLPFLSDIQFPWRLQSVITGLLIALVVGFSVGAPRVPAWSVARRALLLGIVLFAGGFRPEMFAVGGVHENVRAAVADAVRLAPTSPEAFALQHEFLPRTAQQPPATPRSSLVEAPGARVTAVDRPPSWQVSAEVALTTPIEVIINQLYFPGWQVWVGDREVPEAELRSALREDGRIRIHLDPSRGPVQRVRARYAGPPGATVRWLGVLGGASILVALWLARRFRRSAHVSELAVGAEKTTTS